MSNQRAKTSDALSAQQRGDVGEITPEFLRGYRMGLTVYVSRLEEILRTMSEDPNPGNSPEGPQSGVTNDACPKEIHGGNVLPFRRRS